MKQRLTKKINTFFGLKNETNIVLYAPTFRNSFDLSCYDMDYDKVIKTFKERFGGDWKMVVRLHPNISKLNDKLSYSDVVLNGTKYPIIGDLIIRSKVVITDFSGCMFDALRLNRMLFLYASDYKQYISHERGLYFDFNSFPVPIAESNAVLIENIYKFDRKVYDEKRKKLLSDLGFYTNDAVPVVKNIILNSFK